ncbi:PREDICTED: uncharacterized protein LOC104748685 [Camelina sativa]|uniref:Uncharacterized protein LOC104748685 n=1 Tax=Camelina sativa TaxID=90675 RepID=A0ABM0WBF9_CAMSA|nr:PREDICTED: uncharacterized protein LOC104748685 [Camelina sativa]
MNCDEVGSNAITLYVEKEQVEPIKEVDGSKSKPDGIVSCDEGVDNGIVRSDMGDEYVEPPPVVEASQYVEPWEDGLGLSLRQEFPNKKALQDVVNKGTFVLSFGFVIKKSDLVRLVLRCTKDLCKWGLRAARVRNTDNFSIRRYTKMHTCSRASQIRTNSIVKRHGTPELVAALLHDHFPGKMETPTPKMTMDLVKTKLGVNISYSTTLRGKNQAITDLRGSSEDSYKMLYCYLHMLEKVNEGIITRVELDEKERFKYLFIYLGASIEGFQVMRKVIIVDATWLKNGYGGVLIFASTQDPNHHHYP